MVFAKEEPLNLSHWNLCDYHDIDYFEIEINIDKYIKNSYLE